MDNHFLLFSLSAGASGVTAPDLDPASRLFVLHSSVGIFGPRIKGFYTLANHARIDVDILVKQLLWYIVYHIFYRAARVAGTWVD